ncbi:hypothetical protein AVEN_166737-1 [Araneus ventricosus]|uniref:Uncharacterized protein n=1 Tax=Araneus ventricosus TaxID=182803 RepID=A0A4Y2SWM0_ARAVE|nr:hypothetical protein AVEN_166737-1 [Araneus ventricosus]
MGSADDFVVQKRSTTSGSVKPGVLGSTGSWGGRTGLWAPQSIGRRVGVTVRFGLSSDRPSLRYSLEGPSALEQSFNAGVLDRVPSSRSGGIQVSGDVHLLAELITGRFRRGRRGARAYFDTSVSDSVGAVPPTPVAHKAIPTGEVLEIGAKSGQKRKPARVRARTKKVSKNRTEGSVNTLQLDNSRSGSDRTVVVSDTQSEVTVAEDSCDMEVPPTPDVSVSVKWGPASVTPDELFSVEDYSFKNTGISPWIHRLQHAYFLKYPTSSARLTHMGEKKPTGQTEKGSSSSVVGDCGCPSPLSNTLVSSVSPSCGFSVPQPPVPTAPARVQSKVSLKPRPESPTVIVAPLGDSLTSSQALRSLLEEHIRPQQLGLRVLACLPAAENGILVKLHTAEMVTFLETHINGHPELNGICRARAPRHPNPRILVYDVPVFPGTRVRNRRLNFWRNFDCLIRFRSGESLFSFGGGLEGLYNIGFYP